MLKRITTEFTAAVRVIVAENVNVLRCFARDVTSLAREIRAAAKKHKTA